MKSVLKLAAALSVIVTASTSLANPKLIFVDVGSVPRGAERFIKQAINDINGEVDEVVLDLGGIFLGDKIEQDGVNTISFETVPSVLAKTTVKSVTYKSAESTEFDIIIRSNYDSTDSDELVQGLKRELKKQLK